MHIMQTDPAVEQNKNVNWSESPWNQSGRKRSNVERIYQRAKSEAQNERLNE